MQNIEHLFQTASLLTGRFLLGMYFVVFGLFKIPGYSATTEYMANHDVPLIAVLLPVTIILQVGLGTALIIGFRARIAGFLLAGVTLMISLFMHDFWTMAEGMERSHETQNFIKNMGIMAGLLIVAALGAGHFSLDNRLHKQGSQGPTP